MDNGFRTARRARSAAADALTKRAAHPDWYLLCGDTRRTLLGYETNLPLLKKPKLGGIRRRANYDRELVHGILDQAFVCSVGFIVDGQPYVVPTNYVRDGERLLLHGSIASRLMTTLASGAPFCLSVTLLDGIVCSPTATGHSVNYRSVVVLGTAEKIESAEDKLEAMRKFVEYVIRGRWATVRPPSENELKATMVLAVPLVEVSAKTRTGFGVCCRQGIRRWRVDRCAALCVDRRRADCRSAGQAGNSCAGEYSRL